MRLFCRCRYALLSSVVLLAFSVSPRACMANSYPIVSLGSDVFHNAFQIDAGLELFPGRLSGELPGSGVFSGSDLAAWGGEGPLLLNARGEIVWDDRQSQAIYEAIDLPSVQEESIDLATPKAAEPASLVLLGTGVMLLAFAKLRSVKA